MTDADLDPISPRWEPTRTHVFAVGILEYADKVHWPLEGRRDAVLMDALRARGVPASQVTFLTDAQGTMAGYEHGLAATLERTQPGDQLILYYAGHGSRDPKHGGGAFRLRDGRLPVAQIFAWIERRFRGRQAILTADCCYSGALALEAPLRAGRVAYAALGSSLSTVTSTGAWTFTNCWIDAIEGRKPVDLDGDGILRLDELARYAERRLGFIDGQVTSFAVANGFPSTFELGRTRPRRHPREGEFVEAPNLEGDRVRAEIVDAASEACVRVRLVEDDLVCEIAEADLRPWAPAMLPAGTTVRVRFGDKRYDGEVLTARNGMHLVRYLGWDESWDEWVAPDRIVDTIAART